MDRKRYLPQHTGDTRGHSSDLQVGGFLKTLLRAEQPRRNIILKVPYVIALEWANAERKKIECYGRNPSSSGVILEETILGIQKRFYEYSTAFTCLVPPHT